MAAVEVAEVAAEVTGVAAEVGTEVTGVAADVTAEVTGVAADVTALVTGATARRDTWRCRGCWLRAPAGTPRP